jgi:hypothetical protein
MRDEALPLELAEEILRGLHLRDLGLELVDLQNLQLHPYGNAANQAEN